eukprot:COSAG02_NODE_65331_length_258_cov_0.654088_1_plen_44_part_01
MSLVTQRNSNKAGEVMDALPGSGWLTSSSGRVVLTIDCVPKAIR